MSNSKLGKVSGGMGPDEGNQFGTVHEGFIEKMQMKDGNMVYRVIDNDGNIVGHPVGSIESVKKLSFVNEIPCNIEDVGQGDPFKNIRESNNFLAN